MSSAAAAALEAFFAFCTRCSIGVLAAFNREEHDLQDRDFPSKSSRTRTSVSNPHKHLHRNLLLVVVRKAPSGVHSVLARACGSLDAVRSLHRIS